MDISSILQNNKVDLERVALDKFGAVLDDLKGGQIQPSQATVTSLAAPETAGNVLDPVGYAKDLIDVAPKHRFLFKAYVYFNPPYFLPHEKEAFTFLVRDIDRPKVTFESTPINMYNFRTQVVTAVRHEQLNIRFHDDIKNYVTDFFNMYRRAYSPISRMDDVSGIQIIDMENMGMNFAYPNIGQNGVTGGVYGASRGSLANSNINVLNRIEIHHYYAHGTKKNIFSFLNPRIEQFDFDNMDHADGGEGNTMNATFSYDALVLITEDVTGPPKTQHGQYELWSRGGEQGYFNEPGVTVAPRTTMSSSELGALEASARNTGGIGIDINTDAATRVARSVLEDPKGTLSRVISSKDSVLQNLANRAVQTAIGKETSGSPINLSDIGIL